jgi:DNA primase
VIQQYVALRKAGRNWVGLCPFHTEKSGSFNVREETGRYKCFGCQAAGDIFTFVQEIEHIDFSLLNTQYEIYMKTADTDQDTDEDTDSSDEEDVGF